MADAAARPAVKNQGNRPVARREPSPFDRLHCEIDRLFDDFGMGPWRLAFRRGMFDREPFGRLDANFGKVPALDIVETAQGYEITAELPGIDHNNVEVNCVNSTLTIRGEKKDDKEEKKRNDCLSERCYGSFQRAFRMRDGVDPDEVEVSFKNGVLTVELPKTSQMQKTEKGIEIRWGRGPASLARRRRGIAVPRGRGERQGG
jgi:HSP20 family protein